MEDILAIIFIFGGGTLIVLAFSPVGRAIAARIRGAEGAQGAGEAAALREEVELLRAEVGELHERMDFTERLLTQQRAQPQGISAGGQP